MLPGLRVTDMNISLERYLEVVRHKLNKGCITDINVNKLFINNKISEHYEQEIQMHHGGLKRQSREYKTLSRSLDKTSAYSSPACQWAFCLGGKM